MRGAELFFFVLLISQLCPTKTSDLLRSNCCLGFAITLIDSRTTLVEEQPQLCFDHRLQESIALILPIPYRRIISVLPSRFAHLHCPTLIIEHIFTTIAYYKFFSLFFSSSCPIIHQTPEPY